MAHERKQPQAPQRERLPLFDPLELEEARTMPASLRAGLVAAFEMALTGSSPAECAVLYRSLFREFPSHRWLARWASRWESFGTAWHPAR